MGVVTLREYQEALKNDIRYSFLRGHRSVLAVLPTGGGKTRIFTNIAESSAGKGKKVLILAHRIELIRQPSLSFSEFGIRHGIINPKFTPDYGANIQIASVQTYERRMGKLNFEPDLIVVDEAHHANASTWRKIIAKHPNARVLGVTATPVRGDGSGLGSNAGGLFDAMCVGPSVRALMDFGYLVEPIIYGPEKALDFSGIRVKMGDYDKNELGLFMSSKPKIVGDVIAHYRKYCDRVPAVAFCPTVAHAEQVADSFRQAGYRAWSVDCTMEDDHRNRILKGLGNGSVDVVTSCDLIGEGVDIPAVGCAILLRKTQSKGLHIQQIGRALRPFEGKKNAVILDHVGNTMQHGLPDADHVWSLAGEPRKKKGKNDTITVSVTQCMQCYAVHAPAPKCPVCGHQKEQRERVIETEAGELVQITPKSLTQMQKERDQKNARMEVGKSRTLDELKAVAKARGYKDSWAEHVFNSRKNKAQGATMQ